VNTWCAHQQDQQVKEWAYSLAHARTLAITGKFTGGIISALTIPTGIQFFILPVLGAGGARSQL
jgi:hypothetical protein